ncbi:hypothetical protein [Phytopseudomonas daroniae]|uniref:hypothetical protein n=1 Tax=Phytopseudomonas daroniae TaxID=2487519 RepID=UPI0013F1544F|nr:hypothetical protein [Pseudomonas daroniae]
MIINNQYLNQTNTSYLRERRTATAWENRTISKNLTPELTPNVKYRRMVECSHPPPTLINDEKHIEVEA